MATSIPESARVALTVTGGILLALFISYLATEHPFSLSLIDLECRDAQEQYYRARERAFSHQVQVSPRDDKDREEAHDHADVCAQERMADYALYGAWLLFISLGLTAWAALAAVRANKLIRENAISERRAWLPIEDVRFVHPTSFDKTGILVTISVTTKNIGKTPARGAQVCIDHAFIGGEERYVDAKLRFQAQLRRQPPPLGTLLFPQQELTIRELASLEPERFRGIISTLPTGVQNVNLTVLVGIAYRIEGDDAVHITYQPHSVLNIPLGSSLAPNEEREISAMPFIAGEAD